MLVSTRRGLQARAGVDQARATGEGWCGPGEGYRRGLVLTRQGLVSTRRGLQARTGVDQTRAGVDQMRAIGRAG